MEPIYEADELRAQGRSQILDAYKRSCEAAQSIGATLTIVGFVDAYNGGKIKLPKAVRETHPSIHHCSLRRWLKLSDLSIKRTSRRPLLETRKGLAEAIQQVLQKEPDIKAGALQQQLMERLDRTPSIRSIQRYLNAFRKRV